MQNNPGCVREMCDRWVLWYGFHTCSSKVSSSKNVLRKTVVRCTVVELQWLLCRYVLKQSDMNHGLEHDFSRSFSFMHYPHVDTSSTSLGLWRELCQTKQFLKILENFPDCVLGKSFLPWFWFWGEKCFRVLWLLPGRVISSLKATISFCGAFGGKKIVVTLKHCHNLSVDKS